MNDKPLYYNLQHINLGNGVAEHDSLLFTCMIETQHFTDLLRDHIDLVLGSKGSGKSSLFRVFGEHLEGSLLTDWKTIVVTGVETTGDPIFKSYLENFQKGWRFPGSQEHLEHFCRVEFPSLIL